MPVPVFIQYALEKCEIVVEQPLAANQSVGRNFDERQILRTDHCQIVAILQSALGLEIKYITSHAGLRRGLAYPEDNIHARMCLDMRPQARYGIGCERVVGIEKKHILSAGVRYAGITCGRQTAILFPGDCHEIDRTVVVLDGLGDNPHAVVVPAVIHHDTLYRTIRLLGHHRTQTPGHIVCDIVDRHYY